MSGPTPGPWKIDRYLGSTRGVWLICLDRAGSRGMDIAETRAGSGDELQNARLIAAAPDLLEAAKALLEVAAVRIDDPRIAQFDAIRAAIAKAEGRS